jgi:hypothetical protein
MKLIGWLKSNALFAAALFLLVLYRCIRRYRYLTSCRRGYISAWRIFLSFLQFAACLVRPEEKSHLRSPLVLPIAVYLFVALISMVIALLFNISAAFGRLFPHLAVLHFVRRLEYMSLFS